MSAAAARERKWRRWDCGDDDAAMEVVAVVVGGRSFGLVGLREGDFGLVVVGVMRVGEAILGRETGGGGRERGERWKS